MVYKGWGDKRVTYKIVTDNCQSLCNCCVDICPVACIKVDTEVNINGKNQYWIDSTDCIDCGICLKICPVVGAIIVEEK